MHSTQTAEFWLARQMSGAMSADEQAAFSRWLEASEDNRHAFQRLEDTLSATDIAAHAILSEKFENELYAQVKKPTAWRMPAIAASIALLSITLSTLIFFNYQPRSHGQTYATEIGETRSLTLDDGSTAKLNTNTMLIVAYNSRKRKVILNKGEAIFVVARNTAKPFIVELPTAKIMVTGTSFNVQMSKKGTEICVVSGTVRIKPTSGRLVILQKGDSIHIDNRGDTGIIAPFDPIDVLAWRYGKLRFAEIPLQDVVDELNRYFRKKIILRDPTLYLLPVTGEFDATNQAAAIDKITVALGLENKTENGAIVLSKKDS